MIRRSISFKARAEAFCAKLNDGLAAVAFVLAMIVSVVGGYRTIELIEDSAQNGFAMVDPLPSPLQQAGY